MEFVVEMRVSKAYAFKLRRMAQMTRLHKLPVSDGLVGTATYLDYQFMDVNTNMTQPSYFTNEFKTGHLLQKLNTETLKVLMYVEGYNPYKINPNLNHPAQQVLSPEEWQECVRTGKTPVIKERDYKHIKSMGYNAIEYVQNTARGKVYIRVLLNNAVCSFIRVLNKPTTVPILATPQQFYH